MDMGKRIEEAKKKAEADYEAKQKEKAKLDFGTEDFLDDLDIDDDDDLFQFHGRVANLDKAQRYKKLCMAAQWLNANSMYVEKISFFDASPSEANGHITLALRRLSALQGEARDVFAYLSVLADNIYVTCIDDGLIRVSFEICGVWRE